MTPEEIKKLVQQESRKAAEDVYKKLGTQYGVAEIPFHIHDGVNSPQINQSNIGSNIQYTTFMSIDSSGEFSLPLLPNTKRIVFYGFAANNVSGPATKRAIMTGEILFGRTYRLGGDGVRPASLTPANGITVALASNSMYLEPGMTTVNRVATSGLHWVISLDDSATVVASIELKDFFSGNPFDPDSVTINPSVNYIKNQSLLLVVTVEADWRIQGNVVFM